MVPKHSSNELKQMLSSHYRTAPFTEKRQSTAKESSNVGASMRMATRSYTLLTTQTNLKNYKMNTATQKTMFSSKTGGHTVFVNPPYGRGIEEWIRKGYESAEADENTKVVMLIPARTDTKYWHDYVMKAEYVYFIKGRLKFGDSENCAPFPSAVVVFKKHRHPRRGYADPIMGALGR
jgi:hypothetical protein